MRIGDGRCSWQRCRQTGAWATGLKWGFRGGSGGCGGGREGDGGGGNLFSHCLILL